MRDKKGIRWEKHFEDYTVIDLETCGLFGENRNSVIELAAIRIRAGKVVEEFSSLVNPQRPIPTNAIAITGINNEMVFGAPKAEDILNGFLDFLGNDIIVGYNLNTFDYNIIYDLSELFFNRVFSNDFVDIYYAARRAMNDVVDYKLTTICEKFGVDYAGAHRALKDCYLTKAAYDKIYETYGDSAFDGQAHYIEGKSGGLIREARYSEETQQLRELQKVLCKIIEDGFVSEDEVTMLVEWMESNSHLRGNYPFDRVYDVLENVLEDGIIDREELKLLLDKFTEFTSPVKTTCSEVHTVKDKHFVLTGEFSYGSRADVSAYIVSKGGIVDDQVKKCTQFVVIGSLGSQAWKNGVYGSKIKKAMELKDKGQSIELVAEEDFFSKKDNTDMEQLTLFVEKNWEDVINEILARIIVDEQLPEKSLVLTENYSDKKDKITSYSVAVKKPDYPHGINTSGNAKNSLFNIQPKVNSNDEVEELTFCLPDEMLPLLEQKEYDISIKKRQSEVFSRVLISPKSKDLYEFSSYVIRNTLDEFFTQGGSAFGCCSRYEECSDAKKCLHENRLYALGCAYYHSLREGRIFYGKNRNI